MGFRGPRLEALLGQEPGRGIDVDRLEALFLGHRPERGPQGVVNDRTLDGCKVSRDHVRPGALPDLAQELSE